MLTYKYHLHVGRVTRKQQGVERHVTGTECAKKPWRTDNDDDDDDDVCFLVVDCENKFWCNSFRYSF